MVTEMESDVKIQVVEADALEFEADVLVLKYAQDLFGLDEKVVHRLEMVGFDMQSILPENRKFRLVNSMGQIAAQSVLFIGVEPLVEFRYQEIREFARRSLEALAELAPETKHVCMTLHGANYGLDEIEAFDSEIAGLVEALTTGSYPDHLETISIIEYRPERAQRLQETLSELLPTGHVDEIPDESLENQSRSASERLRSAGYSSESKPHIFVAMSFAEEMDDVYHYGILRAVNAAGFVCERADFLNYTGDVLDWLKRRIQTSTLVIADLSKANPNVYLEVGYAWGCGVPTVLVVSDPSELLFDVRGQRYLPYKRIQDLEESLKRELQGLRPRLGH